VARSFLILSSSSLINLSSSAFSLFSLAIFSSFAFFSLAIFAALASASSLAFLAVNSALAVFSLSNFSFFSVSF